MKLLLSITACALALSVTACNGTPTSSFVSNPSGSARHVKRAAGSTPIQHIVLIIQENRTLNNLFATFPGANGTTVGERRVTKSGHTKQVSVDLAETHLYVKKDLNHSYSGWLTGWDQGAMDNFNNIRFSSGQTEGTYPYQYVNPSDVTPYWTMAQEYGLAAAMFTTQGSASFPAHQDLIRGGTAIDSSASLIDNMAYTGGAWGCDSPSGTRTTLITTGLKVKHDGGPFPCTSDFPSSGSSYKTLRDLLDGASLSWKYYAPEIGGDGGIWSAFDVIAPVRYGPEWGTNVSWPQTNIFNDISNGQLANMSWVIPDGADSDHPGDASDTGPSWVAQVVNAVGNSQYWDSTAIVVVWDDWGGFYDNVPPPAPRDDQGGPGFRVPMLAISPYVPAGEISNTTYEFGSIVRYIEDTFGLGRLGTTDGTTTSIADMFDYNQSPRAFQTIGSKYSRAYFLHRKPTRRPVDTE